MALAEFTTANPVRSRPRDLLSPLTLEAQDMRGACVDSRYRAKEAGAIAMAGADAGLLAIGLAAARQLRRRGTFIPNEPVRDAVFSVVGGQERFQFHGDTVHGRDGCAHCRLMKKHPNTYLLDGETANFLASTLRHLEFQGVQPQILQGTRKDRAVFMTRHVKRLETGEPLAWQEATNVDNLWMLEHQALMPGRQEPTQAFVYSTDMVATRLWSLADAVIECAGPRAKLDREALFRSMKQIEQNQLQLTLGSLASYLPTYEVLIEATTGRTQVFAL